MLEPVCDRPPVPLTEAARVVAPEERSKTSVPLSVMLAVLLIEPVAPPLPICKVPALIVVCPV